MPLSFYLNGKLVDSGETPVQEATDAPAQSADGRSLIDFTSATVHQNGSIDKLTDRAYNSAIKLPPSGSYTNVLGAPKATEAAENPAIAAIRQALAVTDASLKLTQDARDAEYQRTVDQQAQNDAMYAQMTNLKPTGSNTLVIDSSLGTNHYSAQVRTKTNS